jgi:hypothetical protein
VDAVDRDRRDVRLVPDRPRTRRVSQVREWARKILPGWGLTEHADIVELIVSELVTNAIVHGTGPVEICLSRGRGHLLVEVGDHGAGQPALRHPAAEDMTGRGLALVDALTGSCGGSWGVAARTSGQPGKTVFAIIPLAPEPAASARIHQRRTTHPHDGTPGSVATAAADTHPDHYRSAPRSETADEHSGGSTMPIARTVLPRRLSPDPHAPRPVRPVPLLVTPLTAGLAARIIAGLERL